MDAVDFMRSQVSSLGGNILTYLDPPYFGKGQSLYSNYFTFSDHERLAAFLTGESKSPWVLSYDLVPEIQSLYEKATSHHLDITYSTHSSKLGKEVLYFGNCSIPTELPPSQTIF